MKIAEDGEILVRGENVTSGYYNAPEETRSAFQDGWFHTGDIGELDAAGHLRIRGRKKEMIVTPEGLNVFPEDVERVLNALPGVRESAVVGAPVADREHGRAGAGGARRSSPGATSTTSCGRRTAGLQDHQRIRAAALLARRRAAANRRHAQAEAPRAESSGCPASATTPRAHRHGGRRRTCSSASRPDATLGPDTTIDELGLSSLERVELMMALEEAFQVTVDEARFAAARNGRRSRRAGAAARRSAAGGDRSAADTRSTTSRRGTGRAPARAARRLSLPTWILPPCRLFMRTRGRGLEHLAGSAGPGDLRRQPPEPLRYAGDPRGAAAALALPRRAGDAEGVLQAALPSRTSSHCRQRLTNSANYYLASLFFNAFPLPQREAGHAQTLRYIGGARRRAATRS